LTGILDEEGDYLVLQRLDCMDAILSAKDGAFGAVKQGSRLLRREFLSTDPINTSALNSYFES